jgi:hypothetical protein
MIDRFGELSSRLLRAIWHYVFADPAVWLWRHPVIAGSIASGLLVLCMIGWLIDKPEQP